MGLGAITWNYLNIYLNKSFENMHSVKASKMKGRLDKHWMEHRII